MKNRTRLRIIFDILTIISSNGGRMIPTRLLQRANLSSDQMNQYTDALIEKGYITNQIEQKYKKTKSPWPHFVITTSGSRLLQDMQPLKQVEELFDF